MVPSDWDLALTCICGPNFRSTSSENSPDFLFVCLFVWLNKTRTVKLLRRFFFDTPTNTQEDVGSSEEEFMEEDEEERDKDAVPEEDILSQVGPFQVPQHHEIIPLSILGL